MKRTPLQRRTPLARTTELARVSRKRLLENRQRTRVVNGLRIAQEGRCARCHSEAPIFGHERVRRSQGGSIVAPECALCNPCNEWAASNPQTASWTGWLVTPKWPHDPALTIGEAWDLYGNVVRFADLAGAA